MCSFHFLRKALSLIALLEFIVKYGRLIFITDIDLCKLFLSETIIYELDIEDSNRGKDLS